MITIYLFLFPIGLYWMFHFKKSSNYMLSKVNELKDNCELIQLLLVRLKHFFVWYWIDTFYLPLGGSTTCAFLHQLCRYLRPWRPQDLVPMSSSITRVPSATTCQARCLSPAQVDGLAANQKIVPSQGLVSKTYFSICGRRLKNAKIDRGSFYVHFYIDVTNNKWIVFHML